MKKKKKNPMEAIAPPKKNHKTPQHSGPRGITLTQNFLSIFFILHWDKKFKHVFFILIYIFQVETSFFNF